MRAVAQQQVPHAADAQVPNWHKRTEVGVIPEDWEITTLSSVSSFITKGSTPTTYGFRWQHDGIPFLRSECVSENGLDLGQAMYINASAHQFLARSEIHPGDILITITGNVGRVVTLPGNFGSANINQHIARIRINDPCVDSRFAMHYLSQQAIRQHFESITTGQAYPQISLTQVRSIPIPVPPLPEQSAIATALSDADALIESLDRLIRKRRAIKQGAMQQLLTGKKRLPGFKGEWKSCVLADLGIFSKGRGIRRDDVSDDGLECIRYGELYTRYHNYIMDPVSRIPAHVARTALPIKNGDLLFAGSGETSEEIGSCAAYLGDEQAFAGGDIVVLTPYGQDSMYLGHLMNHPIVATQKARMGQGDAVVHISAQNLGQVKVTLPPLEEEEAIATVLSDMDEEIAALEKRRAKMAAVKKGMMHDLLTGKVRLVEPEAGA